MPLCKNFGGKVRRLLSKIDMELEKWGPVALRVTTNIKRVLESPVMDIVTAIIPGDLDDKIKVRLLNILEPAVEYLGITESCKNKTGVEKIQCFINELAKKNERIRESMLIKLASIITSMLHNGQLKQHEYDTFIQLQYSLQKSA